MACDEVAFDSWGYLWRQCPVPDSVVAACRDGMEGCVRVAPRAVRFDHVALLQSEWAHWILLPSAPED